MRKTYKQKMQQKLERKRAAKYKHTNDRGVTIKRLIGNDIVELTPEQNRNLNKKRAKNRKPIIYTGFNTTKG